jgi:chromosome segregation ATPase
LSLLLQQLQTSERNVQERAHKITVLQGEVDSAKEQLEIDKETISQLERKLKQSKADNRSVQNELEQLTAKLAQEEEKVNT